MTRPIDLWLQRLAVVAILATGCAALGTGVALWMQRPPPPASAPTAGR